MVKEDIIFAGFGGQGVMLMGRLLAYAGMKEDRHVSWMPSYGPEMRGGTANCTVIVSDKEIPSPLTSKADIVVAMNLPSLLKFLDKVKPGGKLFINTSLIEEDVARDDIEVIEVNANDIALEVGEGRVANMVMLGALINKVGIVKMDTIKSSLSDVLSKRNHDLLEVNKQALDNGAKLV